VLLRVEHPPAVLERVRGLGAEDSSDRRIAFETWNPVSSLSPSFWKPVNPEKPLSMVAEASRPSARIRIGWLAGCE
jgi:hypothetical protein